MFSDKQNTFFSTVYCLKHKLVSNDKYKEKKSSLLTEAASLKTEQLT